MDEMEYELYANKVMSLQKETKELFEKNLLKPELLNIHSSIHEDMPF